MSISILGLSHNHRLALLEGQALLKWPLNSEKDHLCKIFSKQYCILHSQAHLIDDSEFLEKGSKWKRILHCQALLTILKATLVSSSPYWHTLL